MVTANDLYDCVVDGVFSFTTDQLIDLQDLIRGTIEARKKEELFNLREKAIKAMKDYYDAGGGFYDDDNGGLIFMVDSGPTFDDDYYHIHFR